MNDAWITETKRLVDRGYRDFYAARGMQPPKVSKHMMMDGVDSEVFGDGIASQGRHNPKKHRSDG